MRRLRADDGGPQGAGASGAAEHAPEEETRVCVPKEGSEEIMRMRLCGLPRYNDAGGAVRDDPAEQYQREQGPQMGGLS